MAQITLTVTLSADELSTGAVAQARAAAAAAVNNPPALGSAPCASDIKATGPSTFAFDLSPPAAPAPAATATPSATATPAAATSGTPQPPTAA